MSGSLLVRMAGAGAGFVLHALLARLAGADQYGAYSYVLTWVGVMAMVATLGLDVSLVKYVAAYRARGAWRLLKGLVRWSRGLVLLLAGLSSLAVVLLTAVGRDRLDEALVPTIWLGCGVLPVVALLRLTEARLVGRKHVVLAQVPDGVLRPVVTGVLAALLFWLPGRSMHGADAMALHLVGVALAAVTGMALLRREPWPAPARVGPDYETGTWLRASLPLWLEAGMRLLSASLDVILLGALVGMTEAGIYAVANRLAELTVFGTHASQTVARPHIAAAHAVSDRQAVQRAVSAASAWATAFAVLACLVLVPARFSLLRQFGDEFERGATVLVILAAGYLVAGCTAVVHAVMNMTDHQRANMRITAVVLGAKIPLSTLAIVYGGMTGAAIVSSILMAAGCLWSWRHVLRVLDIDGTVLSLASRRSR